MRQMFMRQIVAGAILKFQKITRQMYATNVACEQALWVKESLQGSL
jgi:hypothetical protein